MNIVTSSFMAFMLREQPFSHFSFPRWQSVLGITLIGVLMGLDPRASMPPPEMPDAPVIPLWAAVAISVVMLWACIPVTLAVLRWWLKRGQRWDGQGDLFNLVAASWLVVDVVAAAGAAMGLSEFIVMPVWLYSLWVNGNAISGAIPRASLGYAIGGILLSLIPAIVVATIVGGVLGAILGVVAVATGAV